MGGELWKAACANDVARARELIEAQPPSNREAFVNEEEGWETPLFAAAESGSAAVAALLLEHKADVHKGKNIGGEDWGNEFETPLYAAAQSGSAAVAALLLDHKADVHKGKYHRSSEEFETPLYAAAESGSAAVAALLLDHKADVHKGKNDLEAPLYAAIVKDSAEVVKLLLERKADVHKGKDNKTPFDIALERKSFGALAAIVEVFSEPKLGTDAATFLAIHERPLGQILKQALQGLVFDAQNEQRLRKFEEITKQFIDAQIASAVEQQSVLEEVYANSRTAHKNMYDQVMSDIKQENGFRAFVQVASTVQTILSPGGKSPTVEQQSKDVLELYAKARSTNAEFGKFVSALAKKSGGEFLEAPLKGLFRSLEKIGLRAVGQWDASGLCDIVRGGVQFDSLQNMKMFFNLLCSATDPQGEVNKQGSGSMNADAAGVKTKIVIVRVKNRFDKPTSGGWSDCLVNFYLADDPDKHVCEVQLLHERLMLVRKQMGAHKQYAQFRSAMELLEATGKADVIARLDREDDEKKTGVDAVAPQPTPSGQAVGDVGGRLESLEQGMSDMTGRLARLEQAMANVLDKLDKLDKKDHQGRQGPSNVASPDTGRRRGQHCVAA